MKEGIGVKKINLFGKPNKGKWKRKGMELGEVFRLFVEAQKSFQFGRINYVVIS